MTSVSCLERKMVQLDSKLRAWLVRGSSALPSPDSSQHCSGGALLPCRLLYFPTVAPGLYHPSRCSHGPHITLICPPSFDHRWKVLERGKRCSPSSSFNPCTMSRAGSAPDSSLHSLQPGQGCRRGQKSQKICKKITKPLQHHLPKLERWRARRGRSHKFS